MVTAGDLSSDYDEIVLKLSEVPTLPNVAVRVNSLLNDQKSNSKEISDAIKQDQSITAKVLKVINSPYYGISGGVTDVHRACAFLGYNTIAQIVLGISIFSMFKSKDTVAFDIKEFWKHALGVAVAAEYIAKKCSYAKPEELFTAGLLHDLGKAGLYAIKPEALVKITEHSLKNNMTFFEAEKELDTTRHTIIGGLLAQRWRLPLVLSTCIRTHHLNLHERKKNLGDLALPVSIVSVANKLVHINRIGFSGDNFKRVYELEELNFIGVSIADLEASYRQILESVGKAKEFLKVV